MTHHSDGTDETQRFICQGCGAPFASRRELDLHNAETHGGGSTGGNTDEPTSIGDAEAPPVAG